MRSFRIARVLGVDVIGDASLFALGVLLAWVIYLDLSLPEFELSGTTALIGALVGGALFLFDTSIPGNTLEGSQSTTCVMSRAPSGVSTTATAYGASIRKSSGGVYTTVEVTTLPRRESAVFSRSSLRHAGQRRRLG